MCLLCTLPVANHLHFKLKKYVMLYVIKIVVISVLTKHINEVRKHFTKMLMKENVLLELADH